MRDRLLNLMTGSALVAFASCSPSQPTAVPLPTAGCAVTGDHNTVNCGSGDQTVTAPSPAPSASPGATLPEGSTVKIGAFGQTCPTGVMAPSDGHALKLSCQEAITCTPKSAQGVPLEPIVTGQEPKFFGIVEGKDIVSATPWPDVAYNLNLVGKKEGDFVLGCTVKDVPAEEWKGHVYRADATGLRVELTNHVTYEVAR